MPVTPIAILAVILAVALAAGLSSIAARVGRRRGDAPWWGGLAVGLSYALGHAGVSTPSIPPGDVTDRILPLALSGSVLAVILGGGRGGTPGRIAGYLGLAALAWITMLTPILNAGEVPRETLTWLAASALVVLLATLNVAMLDTPARRTDLWAAMTAFAAGSGVVLVLSNSAVLFQLGGVLAAVLAASLLGSWGRPVGGGVPVAATVMIALIVEGYVYAFLPTAPALLLASAPATLWLTRLGFLARLGPKTRAAIASGLILIPVAVAAVLVITSESFDSSGY